MVNTRQSTSMITAESYTNRAESVAAAAYDKVVDEGEFNEKATVAAYAAAMDFISPKEYRHEATQATAAPYHPGSSNGDGSPPLETDDASDSSNEVENE